MARTKGWYGRMYQKAPVPTLIGTGLAGVLAYFGMKKLFAPPTPPLIPTFNLPEGGKGIPQVGTTTDPMTGKGVPVYWSPVPSAKALYDSMVGFDYGYPDEKEAEWYKLAVLPTNDMVVAVYNTFNKIPDVSSQAAEYGTLVNWIKDEIGYVYGESSKGAALARLEKSGLP